MKISIALATYNGEKYLRGQLDSIAGQTRLPDEMIICDDGSSDSTTQIICNFAESVSFRVVLLQNDERLGSIKNFEKAISQCTCDIIALCDQDDMWLPQKLERQAAMLEQDLELGGVFSDAYLMDQQSRRTGARLWDVNEFTLDAQMRTKHGDGLSDGVTKKKALGCTLMFRSSLVNKIIPIPLCWEHDGWVAWMISIYSKISIIPEPLICYRIHPTQQFGVVALSLSERIQRSKQVGTKMHLKEIEQLLELEQKVQTDGGRESELYLSFFERKIAYLRMRASLPSNRMVRVQKVFSEIGNYRRFSAGWWSLIRDLAL
jgi:glycosyltransferase involved in cell wall biosynthesis